MVDLKIIFFSGGGDMKKTSIVKDNTTFHGFVTYDEKSRNG